MLASPVPRKELLLLLGEALVGHHYSAVATAAPEDKSRNTSNLNSQPLLRPSQTLHGNTQPWKFLFFFPQKKFS